MSKKAISVLLVVLVILYFFKGFFWTTYSVNLLLIIFGFPYKRTDSYFYKKLPLLFIVIILGVTGLFKFILIDVIRDFYYFSIPLVSLSIGYIVSKKYTTKEIISKFIFLGILFSTLHILIVIQRIGFNLSESFSEIRDEVSTGNALTIISLIILIFHNKYDLDIYLTKKSKYVAIIINVLGLVLFGSRTYLIIFIIFFFFLFINKANFKIVLFTIVTTIVLGSILISFNSFEGRQDGEEITFTSKLISSFTEIGSSDFVTERDVTVKYRAYESLMAFQTFATGTTINQIFGRGFGELIDLGLEVKLGENSFQFIPILHNGFLYLLVKTGIIGISCYLIFFILLYKDSGRIYISSNSNTKIFFFNRLIKASVIALLVSNFVVSSLFNMEFEFLQVFLFSIFFKMAEFKNHQKLH